MMIIGLIALAVLGIMVVLGASVLEGENERKHPPDDDGCSEERRR